MSERKNIISQERKSPKEMANARWSVPRKLLVEDEQVSSRRKQKQKNLQLGKLNVISDKAVEQVNDIQGIKQLLPDINLISDILVASILNPKDMSEISLSFKSDEITMPPELLEAIRTHFTTEHDIESELSDILREALVDKGAKILLSIPPSTLYRTMMASGKTMESFSLSTVADVEFSSIGFVKPKSTFNVTNNGVRLGVALEDFTKQICGVKAANNGTVESMEPLVVITDNPLYLLKGGLFEASKQIHSTNLLTTYYGMEAYYRRTHGTHGAQGNSVYYKKMFDYMDSITIKQENPEEVGKNMNPIVFDIPYEAVIPVFVPGEPSNHIGYYIVYDDFGNPIKASRSSNYFKELNEKLESTIRNGDKNSYIKTTFLGSTTNADGNSKSMDNIVQPIIDAYIDQMEDELADALKKGSLGDNIEVAKPEEIFRVMFARQILKQKTRLVYVPANLITYIAFDYNEMGMGISLIEKTKLYSSLRAIMMFVDILAGMKNSVPGRIMNITLDEVDPDPQATIETALNELAAIQSLDLPIGKINPFDILEGIQRASIQVKVNGGEVFPNTSIEMEERRREMSKPDTDLTDFLKKQQYAGFGVTPESVDKGLEGEFATTMRSSDLLKSKRDMVNQGTFLYHIKDHIMKYIFAGGKFYNELKQIYMDSIKEKTEEEKKELLDFVELIKTVYCELPKSDTAVITNQITAFDEYNKFIDSVIPIYINEEMIKGMLKGEYTPDVLVTIQNAVSAMLKRQYIRRQNILPEIDEVVLDETGNTANDIKEHSRTILHLIGEVLPKIYSIEYDEVDKKALAAIKIVTELKARDFPDGAGDSSSSSTTTTTTDEGEEAAGGREEGEDLGAGDFGLDEGGEDTGAAGGEEGTEGGAKPTTEEKPKEEKELGADDFGLDAGKEEKPTEKEKSKPGEENKEVKEPPKKEEEKDLDMSELGLDAEEKK